MSQRKFNPIQGFMVTESNTDDDLVISDDLDTVVGDGADAALADLQDAEADVDTNQATQDQIENSIVALESLLETATTSLDTGGLDPVAAELLQKAVENETAPLGGDVSEVVPALESFTSQSGRKGQTVMAMEGIGEQIQKYWLKLKEYIQRGREAMKAFFIKAKQAIVGLDRRVKGLKAAAGKVNYSMPKKTSVDFGNSAYAVDAATLKATHATLAQYLSGEQAKAAISGAEATASALAQGWGEGAVTAAASAKAKTGKAPSKSALVGGFKLAASEGGITIQKGGDAKGGNNKLLGQSEITAILTELEAIAKMAIEYERNFQAGDRAKEHLVKSGDALEAKLKKEGDGGDAEAGAKVRAALNASNDVLKSLDHPAKELLSYVSKLLSGVGAYVTANLKAYDKAA